MFSSTPNNVFSPIFMHSFFSIRFCCHTWKCHKTCNRLEQTHTQKREFSIAIFMSRNIKRHIIFVFVVDCVHTSSAVQCLSVPWHTHNGRLGDMVRNRRFISSLRFEVKWKCQIEKLFVNWVFWANRKCVQAIQLAIGPIDGHHQFMQ